MIAVTKNIEVPKEWEITNDWDSHRPLLWLSLKNTEEAIAEFGMGHGSTNLIDKMSESQKRAFNSYEYNLDWFEEIANSYNNWWGNLWHALEGYSFYELEPHGLIFVDSAPGEERKYLIEKNKDIANVIVVHDTEETANYVYGMKDVLSTFKYRLDYKPEGLPHTTAVSNFLNVCEWITQN